MHALFHDTSPLRVRTHPGLRNVCAQAVKRD
jgi:hypothetical protein